MEISNKKEKKKKKKKSWLHWYLRNNIWIWLYYPVITWPQWMYFVMKIMHLSLSYLDTRTATITRNNWLILIFWCNFSKQQEELVGFFLWIESCFKWLELTDKYTLFLSLISRFLGLVLWHAQPAYITLEVWGLEPINTIYSSQFYFNQLHLFLYKWHPQNKKHDFLSPKDYV